jgi:thymidine kinase
MNDQDVKKAQRSNPELIIFTGPMFSGKTTRLLAALDRYHYQNKKIMAFKPQLDDRYSVVDIKSHNGAGIPARSISSGNQLLKIIMPLILSEHEENHPDVIAVDEVFMIDGAAEVLIKLFRMGHTIIVSSLEMSAACNPFLEVVKLMPWATRVEKCPAVCAQCHRDAYFTHKKIDTSTSEIEVGGSELYEPRCWACHSYTNTQI